MPEIYVLPSKHHGLNICDKDDQFRYLVIFNIRRYQSFVAGKELRRLSRTEAGTKKAKDPPDNSVGNIAAGNGKESVFRIQPNGHCHCCDRKYDIKPLARAA